MFNGKMKAISLSYDDGITQDYRFVEIINRYNLKCTFNINSGLFGLPGRLWLDEKSIAHVHITAEEAVELYKGHEIAAHTVTHPNLRNKTDEEILREVEDDREALGKLFGTNIEGFAYPGGSGCMDERVIRNVRNTGVRYARTTDNTYSFDLPDKDLIVLNPTVYHMEKEKMEQLADDFLSLTPDTPKLFLIWGHSYELDIHDDWAWFESFCEKISGHDDIFYGTNREVLL